MTEYFSHDYDAREDEKIQNLTFDLGMEGYGIYWSLIEMLYKNEGYMQTHYERLAFALHTDNEKIKSVINDFDLFHVNENAFHSDSVLHRLKLRKGKTISAKKAAKVRWDKVKANDADAMQTHSDSNAIKESKVKERKEKKRERKKRKFISPTLEEFTKYFEENDYSKELALRAWKGYEAAGWHDSQDKEIKNWKQKAQHVWFREENKKKETVSKQKFQSENFDRTIQDEGGSGMMPEALRKLAEKKAFK